MPREHGKDGAFVETVSIADVLDVFDTVEGPVILSADVSDELECSRETARRKLGELYERGDLARRKVSRRVIYWRPEQAGFDVENLQGDPDTTLDTTTAESTDTRDESDVIADVRTHLRESDTGPRKRQTQAMICDVLQHLREHGTAETSELKELLEAEYGSEFESTRAMWNSVQRYFDAVPGIGKGGYGEYEYTGDESVRGEITL